MTKLLTHLKTHPYWSGVRYFRGAGVDKENRKAFKILEPYLMILRSLHSDIAERKASLSHFTTLYNGLKAKDEGLLLLGNIEFMLHVYQSPVLDKYESTFPGYGKQTGSFALERRLEINISVTKLDNLDQATKYAKFAQVFVKSGIRHEVTPEQQLNFIRAALSDPKGREFLMGMKDDQSNVETIVQKLQSEGVPSTDEQIETFIAGINPEYRTDTGSKPTEPQAEKAPDSRSGSVTPVQQAGEAGRAESTEPQAEKAPDSRSGSATPVQQAGEAGRAESTEPQAEKAPDSRSGSATPVQQAGEAGRAESTEPQAEKAPDSRSGSATPVQQAGEAERAESTEPQAGKAPDSRSGSVTPVQQSGESGRAESSEPQAGKAPDSRSHKITTLSTVLQKPGLSGSFDPFFSEMDVNAFIFNKSVPTA